MSRTYYVIVDLYSLKYQQSGTGTKLDEADKFETLEEAQEELKTYDNDFNGAIYKVTEYLEISLKKVEDRL